MHDLLSIFVQVSITVLPNFFLFWHITLGTVGEIDEVAKKSSTRVGYAACRFYCLPFCFHSPSSSSKFVGQVSTSLTLLTKTYLEQLQPLRGGESFNIVLVFFDDLGWGDLSSYGNAYIETPNIDRLAAKSADDRFLLRFAGMHAIPGSTMTGRFPPRTKTDQHVFFNDYHLVGFGRRMLGLANELPKEEITS